MVRACLGWREISPTCRLGNYWKVPQLLHFIYELPMLRLQIFRSGGS